LTLREAYRELGVESSEVSKWVQATETRQLLREVMLLTEAKARIDADGKASLIFLKPGFNLSKERYYPVETLKRDYRIFEGVKMFADHPTKADDEARPERSIKDWVATLKNVSVDDDGQLLGDAVIVAPWMKETLANLRDKDLLSEMGVSINAVGRASEAKIDGFKTAFIEQLVMARSVDFVTESGAGGEISLYEAGSPEFDVDLVGVETLRERRPDLVEVLERDVRAEAKQSRRLNVDDQERIKELTEQLATRTTELGEANGKLDEADKATAKATAQASIKEAVDKAELPDAAKTHLLASFSEAVDTEGLEVAIQTEKDYVTAIREGGRVKGMGPSGESKEDAEKALRESFKRMNPEWSDEEVDTAVRGR
ncbi:hypothetical protein LCGC14_2000720, partial [marine sediment metagenome]